MWAGSGLLRFPVDGWFRCGLGRLSKTCRYVPILDGWFRYGLGWVGAPTLSWVPIPDDTSASLYPDCQVSVCQLNKLLPFLIRYLLLPRCYYTYCRCVALGTNHIMPYYFIMLCSHAQLHALWTVSVSATKLSCLVALYRTPVDTYYAHIPGTLS